MCLAVRPQSARTPHAGAHTQACCYSWESSSSLPSIDNTCNTPDCDDHGLFVTEIQVPRPTVFHELECSVKDDQGRLSLALTYDCSLFTAANMEVLLRHFACLLTSICNQPATKVSRLPMSSSRESSPPPGGHTSTVPRRDSDSPVMPLHATCQPPSTDGPGPEAAHQPTPNSEGPVPALQPTTPFNGDRMAAAAQPTTPTGRPSPSTTPPESPRSPATGPSGHTPWPSLMHQFCEVARAQPDRVALVRGCVAFTYRDLDLRSSTMAATLRHHGVHKGRIVGVLVAQSAALIAGLLAVWKAGAAFVILEGSCPRTIKKCHHMILNAAVTVLLTDAANLKRAQGLCSGPGRHVIELSMHTGPWYHAPVAGCCRAKAGPMVVGVCVDGVLVTGGRCNGGPGPQWPTYTDPQTYAHELQQFFGQNSGANNNITAGWMLWKAHYCVIQNFLHCCHQW